MKQAMRGARSPVRPYRGTSTLAITLIAAVLAGGASAAQTGQGSRIAGAPETAWLDRFERLMAARSGRVLMLPNSPPDGPPDGPRYAVFYAPLATVWLLRGPDTTEVRASGTLHRSAAGDGFVTVTWDSGALTTFNRPPAAPRPGDRHPLATAHDRLLARPLAQSLVALPAGSRLRASGVVEMPDPSDAGEAATLWESLGDHIVITGPEGQSHTHALDDVLAAVQEGAEQ